jgi:ABC-type multidrug transport system ATPase subunit
MTDGDTPPTTDTDGVATGRDGRADGPEADPDGPRRDTTAEDEPTEDASPTVVVDDVHRSFGDVTVLAGTSFEARPGTVSCLVGPNGSGKTTLLRVVAGLLAPDDGTVERRVEGERTVGYLPQTPSFRPQFTLSETLEFYGALTGVDVDAEAVLDRVGLAAVADRSVGALSGGMTRLFGIAQALVGDPPILVLDEPSSGLDPTTTEHVGSVVRGLADDGRTVLLATHELGTVDRIGDVVLVLNDGEIETAASPATLRRETGSETLVHAVSQYTASGDELTVRSEAWEGDG